MKLKDLLTKTTAMPWPLEQFRPTEADSIYRNHAANVLPQLVEAVRRQCGDIYHPDLLEALKIAEDVKSPNV